MAVREGYIKVDEENGDRKLAYASWGDEKNDRVLFCVHGLSRNGRDFDFLAKALENDYRVICPDVAGRGNSDWLIKKKDYNYSTYVMDALSLLDSLNIKKVDWLGTSMGGIMGMIIAAKRPELVNKLVLNDIGPKIPGEALDRIYEYVSIKPEFDSYEQAAKHLKKRMSTFGVYYNDLWDHIFKYSIEEKDGKFVFRYDSEIVQKMPLLARVFGNIKKPKRIGKCPDVVLDRYWDSISTPILVINGEESDILSKDTYDKMLSSKNNVDGIRIPDIGHAPMLMDDKQISQVKEWLL